MTILKSFIWTVLLALALANCAMCVQGRAENTQERISQLIAMELDVCEKVSFTMAGSITQEEPVDVGRVELLVLDTLQHYTVLRGNPNRWRVDSMSQQLGAREVFESQIMDGSESYIWNKDISTPSRRIKKVEIKAGKPVDQIGSRINFPFKTACGSCPHMSLGLGEDNDFFKADFKVLEEGELPDGRYKSVIAWGAGGREITFSKDVAWAPEEIKMYFYEGDAAKRGKLTADDVRKSRLVGRTLIRWISVAEDAYIVPEYVRMECDAGRPGSREYVLLDWKFGADVDLGTLDRRSFTNEAIPNAFDFSGAQERVAAKRKELQKFLK